MSSTDLASLSDADLLSRSLSSFTDSLCSALLDRFHLPLIRMARRQVNYLPPDLYEEIVQQTWESLLVNPNGFDPSRVTAWQFLRGRCRNAIKKVRRVYGFPDPPTRNASGGSLRTLRPLSLEEEFEKRDQVNVDLLTANEDEATATCGRVDVALLLARAEETAPKEVAQSLSLIYFEDCSLNESAARVETDRVTLTRRIRRWAAEYAPMEVVY